MPGYISLFMSSQSTSETTSQYNSVSKNRNVELGYEVIRLLFEQHEELYFLLIYSRLYYLLVIASHACNAT
jgi:hypothetical protein